MEKKNPTLPSCGHCSCVQFESWVRKNDWQQVSKIVGCKKLTGQQWQDGWRDDDDDDRGFFQRNCPLQGVAKISKEERIEE